MIFHIVAIGHESEILATYASATEASAHIATLKSAGMKARILSVKPAEIPRAGYAEKFFSGEWTALPWNGAEWWINSDMARDHYAHISTEDSKQVAYHKPERGKIMRINPGRYLAKYFPNMGAQDIEKLVQEFNADKFPLFTCGKPETFQEIYEGHVARQLSQSSGRSCMSYERGTYGTTYHPAYVYGAGDLQIAWLQDNAGPDGARRILARCVIWPENKERSKLYGIADEYCHILASKLDEYDENDLEGAKLLRIETHGNALIAPYLDGCKKVEDCGSYLEISSSGEIEFDSTSGKVGIGSRYTCERCGDGMDEEEMTSVGDSIWCEHCANNYTFFCEYYQETYSCDDESRVTVIGRRGREETWSESAAHDNAFICENTDIYYSTDYYTSIEVVVSANGDTEIWCSEETGDDYFYCEATEENYSLREFTPIEVGGKTWCEEMTVELRAEKELEDRQLVLNFCAQMIGA